MLFFLTGCTEQKKSTNGLDFQDDKFKVGQKWKYQTRTGEENSSLTILKIEQYDSAGIIIHISVDGLKMQSPHLPGGIAEDILHLPFSKEALSTSVTEMISENNQLPDFMDGYNEWKNANGGAYTIPVSDAVQYTEESIANLNSE